MLIREYIDVDAPVETLWKILTDSEFIRQYMLAAMPRRTGSPALRFCGGARRMGVVYVKGDVVAVDPPDHLAYTIFGPNSKIADIPANYLAMTYDLKECGQNGSALEITQGHFAIVEDGQARYQHSLDGDDSVLKAIKKMAEEQAKSK